MMSSSSWCNGDDVIMCSCGAYSTQMNGMCHNKHLVWLDGAHCGGVAFFVGVSLPGDHYHYFGWCLLQ